MTTGVVRPHTHRTQRPAPSASSRVNQDIRLHALIKNLTLRSAHKNQSNERIKQDEKIVLHQAEC